MKRYLATLLLIVITIIMFLPLKIATANSQSPYLRVITKDTPFFSNEEDDTPLFYLPYTYYVRIIREELNFYHVEYGGEKGMISIDGYVPKDVLFDDGLPVEYPYPSVKITTSTATILFADGETTQSSQYIFPDRTLSYYGEYLSPSGEKLYFVSYNNRLGYVKEGDVIPFTVPIHPNPLTFLPEEEPPPSEEPPTQTPSSNNTETLRYVIIGSLVFAGILTLFITLKNKPRERLDGYFEEGDYE